MRHLLITWTDIFYATGDFFTWIFKGMRVLGHGPNVVISLFIMTLLGYWIMRLVRYRKATGPNSSAE